MKYKLDFCRIQWLNREFLPLDYAFKYNKNESRFTRIFNSDSKHNNIKIYILFIFNIFNYFS